MINMVKKDNEILKAKHFWSTPYYDHRKVYYKKIIWVVKSNNVKRSKLVLHNLNHSVRYTKINKKLDMRSKSQKKSREKTEHSKRNSFSPNVSIQPSFSQP